MLLVDRNSPPQNTIIYIASKLLSHIKKVQNLQIYDLTTTYETHFNSINLEKFYLALNFLYLINRIDMKEGVLFYVPKIS